MTHSVTEIIRVLSEKETLMKELIHFLEEEQRSIIDIDIPTLEWIDDRKRQLLVQLEDSSNHFRQLLQKTAAELNVPGIDNLSCLLDVAGVPSQRTALQGLQSRLLDLGAALDRITGFNRELLQGSLRMVNRSLEFFGGVFRRGTTYGQAGSMVTAPADVRLVCKEI